MLIKNFYNQFLPCSILCFNKLEEKKKTLIAIPIAVYHCGSDNGWSSMFSFRTWPKGNNWTVSVAMFGDMGAQNPQSLPRSFIKTLPESYNPV